MQVVAARRKESMVLSVLGFLGFAGSALFAAERAEESNKSARHRGSTTKVAATRDEDQVAQPMSVEAVIIQTAWEQMFGSLDEDGPYQVIPYHHPDSIQLFLVDAGAPPPENAVTTLDLLEQWSVASGFFHLQGIHWDPLLSENGFGSAVAWGYYEAIPSPNYMPEPGSNLLVGAISRWWAFDEEGQYHPILEQFIPFESQAELQVMWSAVIPPLPPEYSLEQLADQVAMDLAGLRPANAGSGFGHDECFGAKQFQEGLANASAVDCPYPLVVSGTYQQCLAAYQICMNAAQLNFDAARENCNTNRHYGHVAMLGCIFVGGGVVSLGCAIVRGSAVATAWRACMKAARATFNAAKYPCWTGFSNCCTDCWR